MEGVCWCVYLLAVAGAETLRPWLPPLAIELLLLATGAGISVPDRTILCMLNWVGLVLIGGTFDSRKERASWPFLGQVSAVKDIDVTAVKFETIEFAVVFEGEADEEKTIESVDSVEEEDMYEETVEKVATLI